MSILRLLLEAGDFFWLLQQLFCLSHLLHYFVYFSKDAFLSFSITSTDVVLTGSVIRVSIMLAAYWSQQYQLVCLQCQLSTGEYHGIKQPLFHPLDFSMWKRWTLKWLQFNCFVPLFSFEWAPLMVAAGLQLAMEIRCKWSGWTLWGILFCHREMNTEAIHMCDT